MQEMQKTRVLSLGQDNALEQEMATHSTILAWRIPWTESTVAWWTTVHGVAESDMTEQPSKCSSNWSFLFVGLDAKKQVNSLIHPLSYFVPLHTHAHRHTHTHTCTCVYNCQIFYSAYDNFDNQGKKTVIKCLVIWHTVDIQ